MTKDDLLKEIINIDNELYAMSEKLAHKETTSIEIKYYKWQIDILNKRLATLTNQVKKLQNKGGVPKKYTIIYLIVLLLLFCAIFTKSYPLIIAILFLMLSLWLIISIKFKKRTELMLDNYLNESIIELNKELEKNTKVLNETKSSLSKIEKNFPEEFIMNMFEEASINLNNMVDSKNVNLNYKDRDYRTFIIELYNLKIDEKELNNFYRCIIKLLLEQDLNISK